MNHNYELAVVLYIFPNLHQIYYLNLVRILNMVILN